LKNNDPTGELPSESPSAPLGKQAASDVSTVAKGGAVQIAGQISQRGLAMLFTAVASRVIGLAGLGLYRQVSQVLTIASQLGLAGFNYASMRFISRARANKDPGGVKGAARVGVIGATIGSGIVFIGVLLFAERLADAFADPNQDLSELTDLFRLGALYVPLYALMQVMRYSTQAYKTMVPSVMAGNIIQPIARFVLGMAAFAVGLEVAGAVGSLVVSVGVGTLAAAVYFRRMLSEDERAATPKADRGAMIRFALPQGGASMLGVQALGIGILVLGIYGTDAEVGAFAVALALQGPGSLFLGGIVNIWAPVVSDLYDRNAIDRLDALYKTITRWVATFSFPVFAAVILEPDLFASVLAKSEDVSAIVPVAAILAAGNFFYTGTGPTGYVISMSGHPVINLMNSVVAVALYLVFGIWAAREHGVVGIAVVDAVVTAVVNSIRVVEAWFLVRVQPFGKSFLKPVFATAAGAALLLAWRLIPGDSPPLEIAGIAVAAIVYLLVLRAFGIDPEERYVYQMIANKLPWNKKKASQKS
jgi:O-antigen/teichoic acid export membrane protein